MIKFIREIFDHFLISNTFQKGAALAYYAVFSTLPIIIIAISFFSGILLFTLGIIGIYLARIFEQTKGREQYVIKEIIDYK